MTAKAQIPAKGCFVVAKAQIPAIGCFFGHEAPGAHGMCTHRDLGWGLKLSAARKWAKLIRDGQTFFSRTTAVTQ